MPALGFEELKIILDTNLTSKDLYRTRKFLSLIDMENLRALWAKEPLDPRGNLNKEQLEFVLNDQKWPWGDPLEDFLIDYLDKYHTDEERVAHFAELMSHFFSYKIETETGFIRDFFAFQRDLRLVMLGFRSKKMDRDVTVELQYEDPSDPIVAQILAQKDTPLYEPPFEYKELRPIFETFSDSPLELHKALVEYQFNHIIELWGGEIFSLDRILNYMARLLLVERWLELDVQKGINIVDTIEKEIT